MVQWLRIHLPMQGAWVPSLVQEDPSRLEATKSVHQSYLACVATRESQSHSKDPVWPKKNYQVILMFDQLVQDSGFETPVCNRLTPWRTC